MVPWRQSASLLLLGSKQTAGKHGKSAFDYASLFLKRAPNMRFAPDISAFPGGQLDPSDLSAEWPKYLSSSVDIARFARKNADIYEDIDHPYPGLAFRLCALRETFEETGLLLAKSQFSTTLHLTEGQANEWREKIRADGTQFLVMCQEMQVQPDVHALLEWNQYLAAAIAKVRFDTIFYTAALPDLPVCSISEDDHETVSAEWLEPDVAMRGYRHGTVNFLPPQVLELARLAKFPKLADLMDFLRRREDDPQYRTERLLGICYKAPEATLLVMPGDDHYPPDASFATPILSSKQTLKDFDSPRQNRLVMFNKGDNRKWQVHYKDQDENQKRHLHIPPSNDGWENL